MSSKLLLYRRVLYSSTSSSSSRNGLLEAVSSRKPQLRDCSLQQRHSAPISTATNNNNYSSAKEYTSDRIFAPYSVYKGKAAFSLSPCLPTFSKLDSGAVVVERRGSIMMTFMHAIGERKYDWEKRQRFALSATEVGSLIAMAPQDSCEFFHDPSMKSSNAGQVRKSLSIKPHSNGYFISLTVVNNLLNAKDNFSVPVTTAEFSVMKTACSFALPHIMGWDRLTNQQSSAAVSSQLNMGWDRQTNQQSTGAVSSLSKVNPQLLDLEWEK